MAARARPLHMAAVGALALTLVLTACAAPSTLIAQSGSTKAGPSVAEAFEGAESAAWASPSKLEPTEVLGLPFTLWVDDANSLSRAPIAGLGSPRQAVEGTDYHSLGSTSGKTDASVLAMMGAGVAFGAGTSPTVSHPTIGLIGTDGEFLSFAEVPNAKAPSYLPEPAPFFALNATGADSWHHVVVWSAVGSGGKQWTLMAWNVESGVVTELASSSSMTLGFTGISARLVPGLKPPMVNGKFAYFEVAIPQSVYDAATPGIRFHEIQVEGKATGDYGIAVFRVPLDAPGDVVFVGPSAEVAADPAHGDGMFWVAAPGAETDSDGAEGLVGDLKRNAEAGQSGASHTHLVSPGLDRLPYVDLFTAATGQSLPRSGKPNLVLWRDEEEIVPLFGAGSSDKWVVADIQVSGEILVVALAEVAPLMTGSEDEGEASPSQEENPESWLLAWELEQGALVGAARSEVSVPDVYVAGRTVVWGAAEHSVQVGSTLLKPPKLEGSPSSYIWTVGTDQVLGLPKTTSPRIGDDIVALQRLDGGSGRFWSFLRLAEAESSSGETR